MAKLDEVRRRELTCFGSDHHHFWLNAPLSEEALQCFEREQGICLPEDYRAFLRLAGNGGAGPYYGLLPLEKWNDAVIEDRPGYLAQASPLRPNMPTDVEWEQSLNCRWEELFQGTLALVHQGCAHYALLVVTGTYRGHVVYVNLDCGGIPYFVHDPDFLSWYERWLDELLGGYDTSWFGTGLPGREEDMVAVLRSSEDANLRSEALSTLSRILSLSQETLAVVQTALRDRFAGVRTQAASLLGKHAVARAAGDIEALRRDDDPDVRKAAVAALAKLPGASWESAARAALRDQSREVIFRSLCLLKDAGVLRRSDIEMLFHSPDPIVWRDALWASDSVVEGPNQVPIPQEFLRDSNREVRRMAISIAGSRKDQGQVPILLDLLRRETDVELLSCLVSALGNIGAPQAVPELIRMTRHPDGFVRQDTARALGKLGDRRAIRSLKALLTDHTKPERRDEHGLSGVWSTRSVADEAKAALRQIRPPWYRRLFRNPYAE